MSTQRHLIQSAKYKILKSEYQNKNVRSIEKLNLLNKSDVPKLSRQSKVDIKCILESGYFDSQWYLKKYKDVEYSGIDPIVHYYHFGLILMRDPGPKFSTKHYIEKNADYHESDDNPLIHFLRNSDERKKVT